MTTEPKMCPSCGFVYIGYPALSRKDNKTDICPDCGLKEALEDYKKSLEKFTNVVKEERVRITNGGNR